MAPGPELAGRLSAVIGAGLGGLSDQEVLGVLGAVGRMAAWSAWAELTALAEFARRRPGSGTGPGAGPVFAKEAAEEAAWKSGQSWHRMIDQTALAVTMTARLPQTMVALGQGRLTEYKMRIIEGQTAQLTDDDAAKADVILAAAGQVKNPDALRDFARRQVSRLDPEAALRRKERARQNAHVTMWQEDSGNAGLSARQMPTGDAVIAWHNIERRAQDLRAAGVEGTAGQLHVQAVLDFLLGRATPGQGACQNTHEEGNEGACQNTHEEGNEGACDGAHKDADLDEDERESARHGARGGGRGSWVVNPVLIVPWDPSNGRPSGEAELPGYGLIDENDTMELLQAAGDNPASRWCVTGTDPRDGSAVAHGCIPGPRTLDEIIAAGTGSVTAQDLAAALNVKLAPIAKGACEHAHAEPGYRPSRKLRHLVNARNTRCSAPGCGRPAAACDQDHTLAWDDGGISCECNLAPLCRFHHHVKQASGWKLEQPEPGVLTWTSPSGLTRTTTPASYQD
jgi:hypothetical protein